MVPLHWITALFAIAAGAVFALLPSDLWFWSELSLALLFVALSAFGCVSQRSRLVGPCITSAPEATSQVALTFDDGPGARGTPELLDLLAERGAKANFFLVGRQIEQHREIAERIHGDGHLVGNHSFSHTPWLLIRHFVGLRDDLQRCQESIEQITGAQPRFFRPPYGLRTHATHWAASRCGLQVIGWTTGGGDTGARPVDEIVESITSDLFPGSIVLLHDHGPDPARTLEITRRVLDAVDARGLTTARLDEMLPAENRATHPSKTKVDSKDAPGTVHPRLKS